MENRMYELFYSPDTASLAPHFVLEEIGAPFALRLVDQTREAQKTADYLARNPLGRVPTLVDGALVLFESAAICLHLAGTAAVAAAAEDRLSKAYAVIDEALRRDGPHLLGRDDSNPSTDERKEF
jgi:glutathione S-transferase